MLDGTEQLLLRAERADPTSIATVGNLVHLLHHHFPVILPPVSARACIQPLAFRAAEVPCFPGDACGLMMRMLAQDRQFVEDRKDVIGPHYAMTVSDALRSSCATPDVLTERVRAAGLGAGEGTFLPSVLGVCSCCPRRLVQLVLCDCCRLSYATAASCPALSEADVLPGAHTACDADGRLAPLGSG